MKKSIIRSLIALAFLIIISLILLPHFVKKYAIKNSKELIGRQIQLDGLKVNYFTGMIRITDFVMYEEDHVSEFITFDTLEVNLEPFQFFIDEFVMEKFYLRGLHVNLIQSDSSFNFDDLVAFHSTDDETEVNDTIDQEPFRFQLSNIELKHATIEFEDQNINKVTALNDVSFFVPYIGWNQEDKSEAGLRFAFKNEGYFESAINVNPVDGEFEAEITIYHLYLESFKEYASEYMNINTMDGVFNSFIQVNGNMSDAENSTITGFAEIEEFSLTDHADVKFLGAEKLECVISEINYSKMDFLIDSVYIRKPYVYFELDTATNNFFEIFNISMDEGQDSLYSETTEIQSADSAVQLIYRINHLDIDDGVIDYKDNLTGEPFSYYLNEIYLESDEIKSSSEWIDLFASMKLNNRGTLNAEVGLNPANPMDIHLQYVISDFQLGDLNIYSRFYMGFPIVYGDMYYKSDTRISGGKLNSENNLVMQNVELGEKSGGLYKLPLKFALFLLKDRDGVIKLDIPVSGDLNDPSVSVGKIVWKTFKNFIVKVAASPFDFLAGLISVDPNDIKAIEYAYADTSFSDEKMKQLDLLLQLEEKKEGLRIELVYFNDNKKEKEAIAIKNIGKEYNQSTNRDYRDDDVEFKSYVNQRIGIDSLGIGTACRQLVDESLLDTLVTHFNHTRLNQVRQYLHLANDSTSITSRFSNPKAPKNLGSIPVFEIKYFIDEEDDTNINYD